MSRKHALLALAILAGTWWALAAREDRRPAGTVAARPERSMHGVVGAGAVDAWTLRFTAGTAAQVRVDGAGASRLGCVVQDASGNLLDLDADPAGRCRLRWTPQRTGSYRILIRNPGPSARSYRMVAR